MSKRALGIFISYSSKDREWVSRLTKALSDCGCDVWWDQSLLPGDNFQRAIPNALKESHYVITVFSKNSIQSEWVLAETSYAYKEKILIPVIFSDIAIPVPFNNLHASSLNGWEGGVCDSRFMQLLRALGSEPHKEDSATPPIAKHLSTKPSEKIKVTGSVVTLSVALSVILLICIKYIVTNQPPETIVEQPQSSPEIIDKQLKSTPNPTDNKVEDFDIKNTKLGMTPKQIIEILGNANCGSLNEIITNGAITSFFISCHTENSSIRYRFDRNKKSYLIESVIPYTKGEAKNFTGIVNQINKKYGPPSMTDSYLSKSDDGFIIIHNCWGKTCKLVDIAGRKYVSQQPKGITFSTRYNSSVSSMVNGKNKRKFSTYMLLINRSISDYIFAIENGKSK